MDADPLTFAKIRQSPFAVLLGETTVSTSDAEEVSSLFIESNRTIKNMFQVC